MIVHREVTLPKKGQEKNILNLIIYNYIKVRDNLRLQVKMIIQIKKTMSTAKF